MRIKNTYRVNPAISGGFYRVFEIDLAVADSLFCWLSNSYVLLAFIQIFCFSGKTQKKTGA